jgi:magnesium transporter
LAATPPSTVPNLTDPVTQHLHTDFARLAPSQTVGDALVSLRRKPPEGRIIYFYVTDADGRLVGVVPTRRLLLSPPEKLVGDIMVKQVIAIPNTATVLDACEFFTMHRLLALPVVDSHKRLVGTVDVELYTEELNQLDTHERSDDVFQLVGVHLTEAQQRSPLLSFRKRFPWLLCNIGGGILAAFLSGLFEAELQRAVALALFIPVVLALAESVSIQSVSLALQNLHKHRPSWAELARKLGRELLTGALLGIGCALLVGIVAMLWIGHVSIMICLLGGIVGGVTTAAGIGLAMPYLLRLLHRDPQVAAGPIALAVSDMLTLFTYFMLARALI